MKLRANPNWPVLTSYDQDHLPRVAMPLGGIGTGTVSLGGRGDLRDWEIVNRAAKGFSPDNTFFVLYAKAAGGEAVTRVLEGQIEPAAYEGQMGVRTPNHGLPRFRHCEFRAAYPLGQVLMSDPDVPLEVRLDAFNPLVPTDAQTSGIPAAVLRYVLVNKTDKPVKATVCGNLNNFIGADGSGMQAVWAGKMTYARTLKGNHNIFRQQDGLQGLYMYTEGLAETAEQFGTMTLATTSRSAVTHRLDWESFCYNEFFRWNFALLDFWDDFSADGRLDARPRGGENPMGSLAVEATVSARGTKEVTFVLAWHYPNRYTWTPSPAGSCCAGSGPCDADRIGNYYATQYKDAWDVAARTAAAAGKLEAATVQFVRAFCESDLPQAVKEAALNNVSTLRTQTVFRTPDGKLFGFEGCNDGYGCCEGSCTHVWNYEQATAFLFGSLARTMREVELLHSTGPDGCMSFRTHLPLDRALAYHVAAADGQMGCLMKLYREWQLSGDDAMLKQLWPGAKRALEFCWVSGGWDADRDGVMEGCQHNTMDVEYYGPNGQINGWYLGALRAAEEMARRLGEGDFADECRRIFQSGRAYMDARLFNGEYYEHEIRPIEDTSKIASGCLSGVGAKDPKAPEFQLGSGCLADQMVGQYMAHVCGLGYLLDPAHVRAALDSVYKYNFRQFHGHFNNMRTYVLNDEWGVVTAVYPHGRRPRSPYPYFNEVFTGFEYTVATGLIQEGETAKGLRVIDAVRERYDGLKRNPFDEAECGHHYARAMASWAAVVTLTGFAYSGVDKTLRFAATKGASRVFWASGYAWGTFAQKRVGKKVNVELVVLGGTIEISRLALTGAGEATLPKTRVLTAGKSLSFVIAPMK